MKLVPHWVRSIFCFPCQVRTRKLVDTLEKSRNALSIKRAAAQSLKEYVDARSFARRTYN